MLKTTWGIARESLHNLPENPFKMFWRISSEFSGQWFLNLPDNPFSLCQRSPAESARELLHILWVNTFEIFLRLLIQNISSEHSRGANHFEIYCRIPSGYIRETLHRICRKTPSESLGLSLLDLQDHPFRSFNRIPW